MFRKTQNGDQFCKKRRYGRTYGAVSDTNPIPEMAEFKNQTKKQTTTSSGNAQIKPGKSQEETQTAAPRPPASYQLETTGRLPPPLPASFFANTEMLFSNSIKALRDSNPPSGDNSGPATELTKK